MSSNLPKGTRGNSSKKLLDCRLHSSLSASTAAPVRCRKERVSYNFEVLNGSNDPHDLHATYRRKKKMARPFVAFLPLFAFVY